MGSKSVAVTVVGDDRPGIVAGVTKTLFDNGCNLEDVSSTILRGHFAMMLIVAAPDALAPSELETKLRAVAEALGLWATVRPVSDALDSPEPPTHMVSVYGADHPGIVYRVASALAEHGINITDLTSRVIGDQDSPVYALMLEVASASDGDVTTALEGLGEELAVDLSVRPLESDLL